MTHVLPAPGAIPWMETLSVGQCSGRGLVSLLFFSKRGSWGRWRWRKGDVSQKGRQAIARANVSPDHETKPSRGTRAGRKDTPSYAAPPHTCSPVHLSDLHNLPTWLPYHPSIHSPCTPVTEPLFHGTPSSLPHSLPISPSKTAPSQKPHFTMTPAPHEPPSHNSL